MIELFSQASLSIRVVLFMPASLSIISWGVILCKYLHLRTVSRQSEAILHALQSCRSGNGLDVVYKTAQSLRADPLAWMVKSTASVDLLGSREDTCTQLKSLQAQETDGLESDLIFLATTGPTAPFIGLLGTVWASCTRFAASAPLGPHRW